MTSSVSNPPRFRSLDGLRGIAACLVLLGHVGWQNHITGTRFVINGYLSVDMFFMISGLVIAANYSDRIRGGATILPFLGMRFFRLYPLHIAALGMLVGLECLKLASGALIGISPQLQPFTGGQSLTALVANVSLVHGLGWMRQTGWNVPSWSISCECCAYIAFAVAAKSGVLRSKWFLAGASGAGIAIYLGIALTRGTLNVILDFGILRCFAGFACGVLLWEHRDRVNSLQFLHHGWVHLATTGALILVIGLATGPAVASAIPLFALLIAQVVSDRGPAARVLTARAPQFLGRISYSVYMAHEFVIICMLICIKRGAPISFDPTIGRDMAVMNPWLGDVLVLMLVVVVLVLSSATFRFIEEPGRNLGRRLMHRGLRTDEAGRPLPAAVRRRVSESY